MVVEGGRRMSLMSVISEFERQYLNSGSLYHGQGTEYLEGYRNVIEYLALKGSNHKNYRHYASLNRINSIVDDKTLYLTDGRHWNDRYDREQFNPPHSPFKKFGTCFSYATTESIAMWMLYGGTDGNGAMINFDKNTLLSAMSAEVFEFGYFDNEGFNTVLQLDASKVDIKLVDVVYLDSLNDAQGSLSRAGEKKKVPVMRKTFEGIAQISKHASWSYETETRMVSSVSRLDFGEHAASIEAMKVPLPIDDSFVSSQVYDSPISNAESGYHSSCLRGTVDWSLCEGCSFKRLAFSAKPK